MMKRQRALELMDRTISSTEMAARRFLDAAERGAVNGVPEDLRSARRLYAQAVASAGRARALVDGTATTGASRQASTSNAAAGPFCDGVNCPLQHEDADDVIELAFLTVRRGRLGTNPLLTLRGDLDMGSAAAVSDAVSRLSAFPHVYLDCSGLTFVDTAGLEALVVSDDLLRSHGSALHIIDLSVPMIRMLSLCRMNASLT
jgi:anti-anti-sigma factor